MFVPAPEIFKAYDIRGIVDKTLTVDAVRAIGHALGSEAVARKQQAIAVGRDGRLSGPALAGALADGIRAAGVDVIDVGCVPTPLTYFAAYELGTNSCVSVTGSHNPPDYNGLKMVLGGQTLFGELIQALRQRIIDGNLVTAAEPGKLTQADVVPAYVSKILGDVKLSRPMKIVMDCGNGVAGAVAPELFKRLGCELVELFCEVDGHFPNHHPDPSKPENLADVIRALRDTDAEIGLAFDGDGDRVIAVDHFGRVVDGDRLIALAALLLREEGRLHHDTVVVTVMSNLGFHKAMAAAGIEVVTTGVGDRYVLEALDAGGFSVGGEQSGHIIYRDIATTGDGLLAGLRLAQFVHHHHEALADLAANVMTSYPQLLVNVKVAERHPHVAEELAAEIAAAEARLEGDGRILVRASGTEPLIRVMVEAATDDLARTVADELAAVVLARFG